ncbi:hypothetical protein CYXG_00124 [Synechococcus phage S-SSM4]|uniref:Cyanophage outer membrane protein-like beta-barrel domain-containing protein n=1 Tax=Synechococcus phage S-SSM4 TaxID=536466 RepID=M1U2L9_9CAUD|nr:hypothetical protein CYXG_00124 [Synechococcus phage S-SSM4]AGG54188.1 hypothetical protein CYXG_00124 [Synechococcus phage S-SSM4]AGG54453.1 hypothetical protein CYWG_00169 [Cyanophage S-SSM6b]
MIKTIFAAAAAAPLFAGAAIAGPYVNVEANSSWTGNDYTGTTTDVHVGYEGEVGAASYYVQGGPAVVAVDGTDAETRFSGKAGLGIPVSEAVGVYGELSFITADNADDLGVGGKVGLKYSF